MASPGDMPPIVIGSNWGEEERVQPGQNYLTKEININGVIKTIYVPVGGEASIPTPGSPPFMGSTRPTASAVSAPAPSTAVGSFSQPVRTSTTSTGPRRERNLGSVITIEDDAPRSDLTPVHRTPNLIERKVFQPRSQPQVVHQPRPLRNTTQIRFQGLGGPRPSSHAIRLPQAPQRPQRTTMNFAPRPAALQSSQTVAPHPVRNVLPVLMQENRSQAPFRFVIQGNNVTTSAPPAQTQQLLNNSTPLYAPQAQRQAAPPVLMGSPQFHLQQPQQQQPPRQQPTVPPIQVGSLLTVDKGMITVQQPYNNVSQPPSIVPSDHPIRTIPSVSIVSTATPASVSNVIRTSSTQQTPYLITQPTVQQMNPGNQPLVLQQPQIQQPQQPVVLQTPVQPQKPAAVNTVATGNGTGGQYVMLTPQAQYVPVRQGVPGNPTVLQIPQIVPIPATSSANQLKANESASTIIRISKQSTGPVFHGNNLTASLPVIQSLGTLSGNQVIGTNSVQLPQQGPLVLNNLGSPNSNIVIINNNNNANPPTLQINQPNGVGAMSNIGQNIIRGPPPLKRGIPEQPKPESKAEVKTDSRQPVVYKEQKPDKIIDDNLLKAANAKFKMILPRYLEPYVTAHQEKIKGLTKDEEKDTVIENDDDSDGTVDYDLKDYEERMGSLKRKRSASESPRKHYKYDISRVIDPMKEVDHVKLSDSSVELLKKCKPCTVDCVQMGIRQRFVEINSDLVVRVVLGFFPKYLSDDLSLMACKTCRQQVERCWSCKPFKVHRKQLDLILARGGWDCGSKPKKRKVRRFGKFAI